MKMQKKVGASQMLMTPSREVVDHTCIAERWKAQYCPHGAWRPCKSGIAGSKQIYAALLALGSDPQPEDIERIIGNDTWTRGAGLK